MGKRRTSALVYLLGVIGVAAAIIGVVLMGATRNAAAEREARSREEIVRSGPRVVVVKAERSAAERRVELQGEARPFASVTLYAKVSGYLRTIRVDKGDRVKKNQVLAVIDSPELDRQYEGAVANARYRRADARRTAALAGPGVISAREAELNATQAKVADSEVAALASQRAYQVIRAPFDGVVTARFVDPGALVQSAANAQTGALPVVTVSQAKRLRVYVYVDQRDVAYLHAGDPALVTIPERPNVRVESRVARLSSELDPKTRTMLVEIDVDNRSGQIVPGSYVAVSLTVPSPRRIELPVEALVMHDKKPHVAFVTSDNKVSFRPVVVTDDDGAHVRIESGISEGDRVALNLGDAVAEGASVQPVGEEPNAPANH